MTKRTLFAGGAAAPFAHLMGGLTGRRAGKPGRAEDENEKPDAAKAEDDEDEKKDAKKKGEEPDDPPPEDDVAKKGEDDEDEKGAKAKKKGEEEDDDSEACAEEDSDDEEVAAAAVSGRKAERARCAKIFGCPAAGVRPDVAAQLAFTTDMPSAQAIGVLNAVAAGHKPGAAATSPLHQRMAKVVQPDTGSDAPQAEKPAGAKGAAAAIAAAVAKVRPA